MTMKELEDDARLRGLMAMLALPARRTGAGDWRRVTVEVEIASGMWAEVDSVIIEADKFTVCRNGLACWTFLRSEGIPKWRSPDVCAGGLMVLP
jgi:hypothetical protein